jgi:hypothetical protein
MKWQNAGLFSSLIGLVLLFGCANGETSFKVASEPVNATIPQAATVKGEEFSPDALLEKLTAKNQQFATGWNPATGIWVISVQEVSLRKGMTEAEAADIAAVRAKNQIASFIGSSVTAQEELIYIEETMNGKAIAKEFFKSVQKVDVNQFLRGVTIFNQKIENDILYAAFYATGKLVDASLELEKQLAEVPPGTVQAVGFGIIIDAKIAPAKQLALQNALRNAVEQVMGTMLVGQSQLMDNEKVKSKVISQTVGNIKQYRIVKEAQNGHNYQVVVNAQIAEKQILDNYAAMVRSMGNPGFFIKTVDPDLQTALAGFLADLGFFVTTNQRDAQFIVDADCKYIIVKDEHYGDGIQIDLELRLHDVTTNQQLIGIRNVPRLTTTYSGSFHQLRQSAAGKAFKTMKKNLHEKLNQVVMDWILNGHNVKVAFHGFPGNQELVRILEDAIAGVPCAKIHTKSISRTTIEFLCSYVGPTADFEYFLQERLKKDLPATVPQPETTQIQLSTLEFNWEGSAKR